MPATDNGHEVRLVGSPLDADIIEEARRSGYHKTLKRQLPPGAKLYKIEELAIGQVEAKNGEGCPEEYNPEASF